MQDGQFQEAESEVIHAATFLVRTLLAEGVDPDRLRHVLRSLMLYDLIGSMACDDPWATFDAVETAAEAPPFEDGPPGAREERMVPCPGAAQGASACDEPVRAVGRPLGMQLDGAAHYESYASRLRACDNPACMREAYRDHRHCCQACRDHHWGRAYPNEPLHDRKCGRHLRR